MRLPGTPIVYAFDTNLEAQLKCKELSNLNKVEQQVNVGGFCDAQRLQDVLGDRSLVVCDCEGYEVDLLQPEVVSHLKTADIIVETHDHARPGIKATLLQRFESSHIVHIISVSERDPVVYPAVQFLTEAQQKVALSEFCHSAQQWLFMVPKSVQHSHQS